MYDDARILELWKLTADKLLKFFTANIHSRFERFRMYQ